MSVELVSIHGGHSGQFCQHARDDLAAILDAYVAQGYHWVGVTEHMAPLTDAFRAPDEVAAGLSAADLAARFDDYMRVVRAYQAAYAGRLTVLVAFETECYQGALAAAAALREKHRPDYIVGSIHHVDDESFDFSTAHYAAAAARAGGVEALYARYFDQQLTMIETLRPEVVGHFDYIRILDPDYATRWSRPSIWSRVERNLDAIADLDLILDYNTAPLRKGGHEPFVAAPIVAAAVRRGIPLVPGDDSHGVAHVGQNVAAAAARLRAAGAPTLWARPDRARPDQRL